MLNITSLGERIRELRKAKGLTQGAFAEHLRVSFQAVSNWERGVAPPDLDNLVRIASFFEVLVDDLLRNDTEPLCLGIDGGGTKTEFALTAEDGTVVMSFKTEGSNPNDHGIAHTVQIIREGVRRALLAYPSLRAVFCGISGISTADYASTLLRALREEFPSLIFDAKTDAINIFYLDDEADMTLISGTGSVVQVRRGEGILRLGGHGHLFDTAGSAYDIGRDAISLSLKREDEGIAPSLLCSRLREALGVNTLWDAVGPLYQGGKPKIASLAPIVLEAAREGDNDSIETIEKTATRLAELLNLGVNKYGARPVAVVGGGLISHYEDLLLPRIRAHTAVELHRFDLPPVLGACRVAWRMLNGKCHEGFYENFKNSYGGN